LNVRLSIHLNSFFLPCHASKTYRAVHEVFESSYRFVGGGKNIGQPPIDLIGGIRASVLQSKNESGPVSKSSRKRLIGRFVIVCRWGKTLRAVRITDEHRIQVRNYLSATKYPLGILVNFGHYPKLQYERIVR